MTPHLLRCQWVGVGHYTLNIGRLEAGAPSTFPHLGYYQSGNLVVVIFAHLFYLRRKDANRWI